MHVRELRHQLLQCEHYKVWARESRLCISNKNIGTILKINLILRNNKVLD